MILLCIALLLHLCSAKFGQTISKHNPDIPAFLYSTVSSFRINAHAAPPNTFRNLRTKTPSRAPFGSHVDISFGTEGRIARNYSLKLELNDDILSKDYQITLNGNKLSNSTKSTAYKADLPNNKGWVRVTLVANHPELFHAFVFHADEIDMIVVEPYETSELSRTSSLHDDNVAHRKLREDTSNHPTRMVAYSHVKDVHPEVQKDTESTWHATRRLLHAMSNQKHSQDRRLDAMGTEATKQIMAKKNTYKDTYTGGKAIGCPDTQQKLIMGLAADAGFYQGVSGTTDASGADKVAAFISNTMNLANVLFAEQFNVFLSIGEYVMYSTASASPTWSGGNWNQAPSKVHGDWNGGGKSVDGCPISKEDVPDTFEGPPREFPPNDYLRRIREWTNNEMSKETSGRGMNYGLWHVFTACFPAPGILGVASMGATCTTFNSGWSTLSTFTWSIFTHEVGHNFGAHHTMTEGGIMSYDNAPEFVFKGENPQQVCNHIAEARLDKLNFQSVPGSVCYTDFLSGTCGNYILEPGEDCDGGSCCTNECKLKPTSYCNYEEFYVGLDGITIKSSINECCTSYCKPR